MPDRLADLATTMTALAKQMAEVRDTLAATAGAQEHRTTVLRRMVAVVTAVACLAVAGAATALFLLGGAIGDLRDQQHTLRREDRL